MPTLVLTMWLFVRVHWLVVLPFCLLRRSFFGDAPSCTGNGVPLVLVLLHQHHEMTPPTKPPPFPPPLAQVPWNMNPVMMPYFLPINPQAAGVAAASAATSAAALRQGQATFPSYASIFPYAASCQWLHLVLLAEAEVEMPSLLLARAQMFSPVLEEPYLLSLIPTITPLDV